MRALSLTLTALAVAPLLVGPAAARERRPAGNPWLNQVQQQRAVPMNRLGNVNLDLGGVGSLRGGRPATGSAIHTPWDGALTAKAIRTSIDDALLFLRRQQQPNGAIGNGHWASGGPTALAALAMLAAGKHPVTDPELSKAIGFLETLDPDNTYVRGIRANVWEYALRKVPGVDRWRKALKADFDWLLAAHNGQGWRYNSRSRDWDNSCTQYGVLGLWAGLRAGYKVPKGMWAKLSKHFLKVQNPDGGWGYVTGGSTANMATAGLASMFLVFDAFHGKRAFKRGQAAHADEGAEQVLAAIAKGMDWLGKQEGRGTSDSYYLYGIERTAVAGGRKYIGGADWFRDGAVAVLKAQQPNGSIALGRGPVIGTALATLFMVYGGAPVAFDKLQWGDDQDWNRNPRDLANVTRQLWSAYERPLNWHTVSLKAPVEEFEAPILFLSGTRAPTLTPEDKALLRQYVARGGVILAEPSDGAPAFKAAMEALAAELFPDGALTTLGAAHPVFTVVKQTWKDGLPRLRGLDHGGRTVFFLSDGYLAESWQVGDVEADAFKLAMNLLFYATDRAALAGRFSDVPGGAAAEARGGLVVGVHGINVPAAQSWATAGDRLTHHTGVRAEARPVALTELDGVDVLHISGRGDWTLTPMEAVALQAFVLRGGTLLVDAWGGDATFAAQAHAHLTGLYDGLAPMGATHPLVLGQFSGGADLARARLTLAARRALRGEGAARTHGLHLQVGGAGDGRVLFSPFDVGAALGGVPVFDAAGYTPAWACKLVGNLLAQRAG